MPAFASPSVATLSPGTGDLLRPRLAVGHDFRLEDTLNRYFEMGCQTFTRHELLAYGGNDPAHVEYFLLAWETKGLIQILKPLHQAEDAETCIKLLQPIRNTNDPLVETLSTPIAALDPQFFAYLKCDLPWGYPFGSSLSLLYLLHIREHHRTELLLQQATFLETAECLACSHPWLTYLAVLKHLAVIGAMPHDKASWAADDREFFHRCEQKCAPLLEEARMGIDEAMALGCERLVLLQSESFKLDDAERKLEALLGQGLTNLKPQPPLSAKAPARRSLPPIFFPLALIGLGVLLIVVHLSPMAGTLLALTCAMAAGLIWALKYRVIESPAEEQIDPREAWLETEKQLRACRDAIRVISALPPRARIEGLLDIEACLAALRELRRERFVLEEKFILPFAPPCAPGQN